MARELRAALPPTSISHLSLLLEIIIIAQHQTLIESNFNDPNFDIRGEF